MGEAEKIPGRLTLCKKRPDAIKRPSYGEGPRQTETRGQAASISDLLNLATAFCTGEKPMLDSGKENGKLGSKSAVAWVC